MQMEMQFKQQTLELKKQELALKAQQMQIDLEIEHRLLRVNITHYLEVKDADWLKVLKQRLSAYYSYR
jgi:hypothetical protein